MSTATTTGPRDARHEPVSRAQRLRHDADEAARVRALANHPDVIALRVEKVRGQVDAAIWVAILLGLAFTMVNVQGFAAEGAAVWSLPWLAAWLLDPMVSLTLIAVLRAEQITARYQVHTGRWAHRTKWFAFLATYVMNTWSAWRAGDVAGVVLHSVPPVLVFLAAETAPVLRDRLTEAVFAAAGHRFTGHPATTDDTADAVVGEATANAATGEESAPVRQPAETTAAPAAPARARSDSAGRKPAARKTPAAAGAGGRKLLADYVAEARAAHTPGIDITPAWVRSVTACGRGTSKNVADTLRSELDSTHAAPLALPATQPVYGPAESVSAEPVAAATAREAA